MLQLQRDASLREFNTFGLPATARYLVTIDSEAALLEALATPELSGLPRLVLGGGSNVVLTRDFDGVVLRMAIRGRERLADDAHARYVRGGAGEVWHDFVDWTLSQDCPGLENLALIPGTLGAAPIQNIGAYGLELAERFAELRALDTATGQFVRLTREACAFGYRDSLFKREPGRYIVVAVTLRLPQPWQAVTGYADVSRTLADAGIETPDARQLFDAVAGIRRRKLPDPMELGNAGSFFKNPVVDAATFAALRERFPQAVGYAQPDGTSKVAAGWLIDQCGWRGKSLGRAGVHERQALVLVNRGGASGADIVALARAVQASVQARFGITLEPEPLVL
ncbi:UDP-N-acetylmuramate dehydrogenase [Pandoraea pulmonicola]|uniref:UDP-N-acetylenolpyruvoylglucosamine reductase n=1 Tax=Pandoraea pulmonicola TaxID=93221 RepID=A0AAJ4ZEV3_PANPU|nr:UDP-N-acetylmuramate dehydrogenase [Pandoraea pulmonicola]AJC19756.1 UDP-N-acetylenolpyruvoylglucosamine reductase [Pandoraea pulmonicola]SUA92097.1 UDP-N-acetylenolpyruvoylglucosamine reductase [Pandoraea pulmonicola]